MTALISTEELAQKLSATNLRVIDASWVMPAEKRDVKAEYALAHIPGAVFFDIDEISDKASPYPHMLPSAEQFAKSVATLGISNSSEVIVYDSNGLFSAARVWWMFRIFGHEKISVLNGGLPKWKAEGRPLESNSPKITPGTYTSHKDKKLVRLIEQVQQTQEQIIDARSAARFNGTEPEPRAGLRSGHIPGSINVHYKEVLQEPYNTLKPTPELKTVFRNRQVDIAKTIIASCGSGVTACILTLALYELGNHNVAVYDGSWAEWGSIVKLP